MADELTTLTNRLFRTAMIWTVLAVLGIPLTVFGAINLNGGTMYIICLALGVIFIFSGFYGCPITWVQWAEKKRMLRLVTAVRSREISPLELLAAETGRSVGDVHNDVTECLRKGWINGYVLSGDKVMLSKFLDPGQMAHHVRCDFCNATYEYVGTSGRCPYCGNWHTDKP